jgi:hypothetical protein
MGDPRMMPIIVDLDDLHHGNVEDSIRRLERIREQVPGFLVTLFTIPGRMTLGDLKTVWAIPWISMVPHGFLHDSSRECEAWSRDRMAAAIDIYQAMGHMARGFKAPGWQISDGCYEALAAAGYWVADQTYNDSRRPASLPVYLLDNTTHKIHGHLGHLGGHNANELEFITPAILAAAGSEFGFVKDHLQWPSST